MAGTRKRLGELVLRSENPQALVTFYREVIGFEPFASGGSLHHFAFAMEKADFDAEQRRLMALGVPIQVAEHPRFGWRSIYLFDPDGNSDELVCFDAGILESSGD